MALRTTLRATAVAFIFLCGAGTPLPAAVSSETLKTDIDSFFTRLQVLAQGRVRWDGADSIDVNQIGAEAAAVITKARISLREEPADAEPAATVTLDRIEIHERPAPAGGDLVEATISLPNISVVAPDGVDVELKLNDAKAVVLLEGDAERQREATLSIASARLDEKPHASWATLGPITGSWKTIRNADGSWRGPFELVLKRLEFLIPEAPAAGSVERISYGGEAAGPSLADMDAFRDRAGEVRDNFQHDPEKRSREMLALLPQVLKVFSYSKGNATVEQATVKRPGGEMLFSLAKAWIAAGLSGFDGEKAAFRITLGHDGLALAPSLAPDTRVPRSADLDFGIEDLSVATLRSLADAASQFDPEASAEDRQKLSQQVLAGAMALQPVLRIYEAMANFKNVAVAASGEARRAPPAPVGYAATGDVTIRGFDALDEILTAKFDATFLPLLKYLGVAGSGADGAGLLTYHLASGLSHPLTLNGSDISAWLAGGTTRPTPGHARVLRLEEPPLTGDDVRAVQKAVQPVGGKPFADGVYDGATAVAVAAFQKQGGLNVNGVVDAATRDKLGIAPPPAPAPKPPGPKN